MLRRSRDGQRGAGAPAGDDAAEALDEIGSWLALDRPFLGEILLEMGRIDADQLTDALQRQLTEGGRLGELLQLDEEVITEALGRQFELRVVDLRVEQPAPAALELVGETLARRFQVLPFAVDDEHRVWIVTSDPRNAEAIRSITATCGRVGMLLGNGSDIDRIIDQAYNVLADASVYVKAHELAGNDVTVDDVDLVKVDENAPVVQVVNRIITQGVRSRASDVHIESQEHAVRVRYRVDGALSDAISLPASMGPAVISRIKVMADLNIVEKRRPQDGQFSVSIDERPIDVRTSVVATVHGEKVVLRLLDKQRSLINLGGLGMRDDVLRPYMKIVKAPLGMMLVTGPTGSGKTTTLYATLAEVNDPQKNVVTVEDPVEYQFEGINQMQISEAAGITFADGLRGILRQDPDTILVGEIRDPETARIAMQAALTGHLVLSSLHAVDSVAALHRFTDMGLEPFLVASAVTGVIGQRLLRRNCHSCAVEYRPSPDRVRLVAAQLGTSKATFRKGDGCNLCNYSGYRSRVGVYELLTVSDAIRQMIVEKATHTEMRKVAVQEGMKTMQLQAFQLVAEGITTIEEVLRSVYAPGVDLDLEPLGELMPPKRELTEGESDADESIAAGTSDATDDDLDDLPPPEVGDFESVELQPVEGGA